MVAECGVTTIKKLKFFVQPLEIDYIGIMDEYEEIQRLERLIHIIDILTHFLDFYELIIFHKNVINVYKRIIMYRHRMSAILTQRVTLCKRFLFYSTSYLDEYYYNDKIWRHLPGIHYYTKKFKKLKNLKKSHFLTDLKNFVNRLDLKTYKVAFFGRFEGF